MDFKSYLETSAEEINVELEKFLKSWSEEVTIISPKLSSLNQEFVKACEGGKRLRGALVKLGYEIAGDSIGSTSSTLQNDELLKEILKPAVAFEIFQTAILAHDDIIDLSPLRRGKPTIYKTLGGDHYGISQTICLGDIGFFLAYKLISESNFPEKEKNLAISFFTKSMLDTALGEMLDIELPHQGKKGSQKDILTIFHLKTAMYTIIGPLSLGIILGGENEKLLQDIKDFGHDLGIAFQIQDDILGVFGDEKTLGKSVTSDIEEGKNTLLIIRALKNASAKQNQILKKYYGQGKIGVSELEQIKKVFIDTGALEYSKNKAMELVKSAQETISGMEISEDKKEILLQMSEFLVKRDK